MAEVSVLQNQLQNKPNHKIQFDGSMMPFRTWPGSGLPRRDKNLIVSIGLKKENRDRQVELAGNYICKSETHPKD